MRNAVFWTVAVCVVVSISTWRGDVAAGPGAGPSPGSGSSGVAPPEPITGVAAMPNPGSESQQMPPFTMYSHGGSNAEWSYAQLTPAEQAYVDREPSTGGNWQTINDAFAAASHERAQEATSSAAATQLGVPSPLASTGVVP